MFLLCNAQIIQISPPMFPSTTAPVFPHPEGHAACHVCNRVSRFDLGVRNMSNCVISLLNGYFFLLRCWLSTWTNNGVTRLGRLSEKPRILRPPPTSLAVRLGMYGTAHALMGRFVFDLVVLSETMKRRGKMHRGKVLDTRRRRETRRYTGLG